MGGSGDDTERQGTERKTETNSQTFRGSGTKEWKGVMGKEENQGEQCPESSVSEQARRPGIKAAGQVSELPPRWLVD